MNQNISSIYAWAGPVFLFVLGASFLLMGFLPPLSADMNADEVAAIYEENRTAIRTGATIIMQAAPLMFLWVAAIASQLRRIESSYGRELTYAQLLLGFTGNIVFLFMSFAWTIAAFRPERSPEMIAMLNDIGWLIVVMPVLPLTLQAFVIGIAVLSDKSADPLFPRWSAYLNFWVGILLLPGALTTFFKSGPFAWHGLFVFWVPIAAFIGWVFVMAWLVSRAATKPADVE